MNRTVVGTMGQDSYNKDSLPGRNITASPMNHTDLVAFISYKNF